jgi:hypothetical protein
MRTTQITIPSAAQKTTSERVGDDGDHNLAVQDGCLRKKHPIERETLHQMDEKYRRQRCTLAIPPYLPTGVLSQRFCCNIPEHPAISFSGDSKNHIFDRAKKKAQLTYCVYDRADNTLCVSAPRRPSYKQTVNVCDFAV